MPNETITPAAVEQALSEWEGEHRLAIVYSRLAHDSVPGASQEELRRALCRHLAERLAQGKGDEQ